MTAYQDDIPETGAVFTFGKSRFADNEPSHFFIKNDPIIAISCGDEHSAVICQQGRVFVFGGNAWGQLGLGHSEEVSRPSCVKWLKPHRALFVACGRAHTVFVTDTHAIYTVGHNGDGQLGTGNAEHQSVPQYVELESENNKIKQVSAGSNHTAILTEGGQVFMCGSNTEGQLGLGEDIKSSPTFKEVKFMEKIAFVECGYYHTVFITSQGIVFVTGENEGQKLGTKNMAPNIYVPEVLPISTPIKSACCGASHTFLLSMDESKILAFGSNDKGQLGLPKSVVDVIEPTEICMEKMFDGYQLKLVACGATHTAFVTDNGLLYTCGESRNNKLCLEEIDNVDNSVEPDQYTPKRVTAMNGFIVDNVACGGCHTLLTATKGSNSDFTNNDFNLINDESKLVSLTELPPLQKVPTAMNRNIEKEVIKQTDGIRIPLTDEDTNGNTLDGEDSKSIDSLEANVSGSHIVNINDLDNESVHDVPDIESDNNHVAMITNKIEEITNNMEGKISNKIEEITIMEGNISNQIEEIAKNMEGKITNKMEDVTNMKENITNKMEEKIAIIETSAADIIPSIENTIMKETVLNPGDNCDEKRKLGLPDTVMETQYSPPPKSPILQNLLHLPEPQTSPDVSRKSESSQKSETCSKSENETIICSSDIDKASPQIEKVSKTQAVMPIVRSEDNMALEEQDLAEVSEVVTQKLPEKGRFGKIFQAIRDKENSCMGKGKVIENVVVENVHKGISGAEQTVHKVEETIETEIRNQTNSRTCVIL